MELQTVSGPSSKIIDGRVAVLEYHIRQLELEQSNQGYCNFLKEKIIPLIRLLRPEMVKQWVVKKQNFITASDNLTPKVLPEVKEIYEILLERLTREGLLELSEVKSAIMSLRSVLDGEICVMPPRHEVAMDRLKHLFYKIAELGRGDIIAEYVEIFAEIDQQNPNGRSNIYQCCACIRRVNQKNRSIAAGAPCPDQGCGGKLEEVSYWVITCRALGIVYFNVKSFVPSYYALKEAKDGFYEGVVGAWDHLCALEWGWPTDRRDAFRKKKLSYENINKGARAAKLLNACHLWKEIVVAKNYDEDAVQKRKPILFRKEILEKHLRKILAAIYDRSDYRDICDDDLQYLENIRIFLERDVNRRTQLRVIVKWSSDVYAVYQLHGFHDADDNRRHDFIASLINNKTAVIDSTRVSGGFAAKFLEDMKIIGVLEEIFIKETKGAYAVIYSDMIDLSNKQPEIVKRVRDHLNSLEFVDWRRNRTDGPTEKLKYRSL